MLSCQFAIVWHAAEQRCTYSALTQRLLNKSCHSDIMDTCAFYPPCLIYSSVKFYVLKLPVGFRAPLVVGPIPARPNAAKLAKWDFDKPPIWKIFKKIKYKLFTAQTLQYIYDWFLYCNNTVYHYTYGIELRFGKGHHTDTGHILWSILRLFVISL